MIKFLKFLWRTYVLIADSEHLKYLFMITGVIVSIQYITPDFMKYYVISLAYYYFIKFYIKLLNSAKSHIYGDKIEGSQATGKQETE